MLRGTYRRGAAAWEGARKMARTALVILGGGVLAAGCTTSGPPVLGAAGIGASGVHTVTFESIDGPPEALFHKLVTQLTEAANAHHIAVVSRESSAQFRIRA